MNHQHETFVIARTEDGFRVYNPEDPARSYIVGGGPDQPTCTCPEFHPGGNGPNGHCRHILAVLQQVGTDREDPDGAAERQAIQMEAALPHPPPDRRKQMVIKRSVSPDGRIDSLSVEFSCPVNGDVVDEVKDRALETMALQDEIVHSFLAANGKGNGKHADAEPGGNGTKAAQMLFIGGINTKWGRRLYIAFQSNGQTLKLFGSRKQLADALTAAGYPQLAERIAENTQLNVPCAVVTKPSEDGRYLNIEQVLPTERPRQRAW